MPWQAENLTRRRYASRLAAGHARTSTLSLRLTPTMKDALNALAADRAMSVCEYAARVIHDHLRAAFKR